MQEPAARAGGRQHRPRQRAITLIELMLAVAIVGVLAAVCVQSYSRRIRHSKTAEAISNIRRIYESARAYIEFEQSGRSMAVVPKQFPASIAPSPPTNTCCDAVAGVNGKCIPSVDYWASPGWSALSFAIMDPHYYWYEFVSSGTASTARFTARANGNLDCDTLYSTFEMTGWMDNKGMVGGQAGMFRSQDTE
ncbi:MAG: prepilin-type N-terminal cleavage/methylation domain-containing protein [Pseudomonadota bacterium]